MHIKHPISHTYFLGKYELESWECQICHIQDVNSKHGGYYCSHCKYIAHAKCAVEDYNWYKLDESDENPKGDSVPLPPYSVVKETRDGDNVIATEIKHFSHQHNLVFSNGVEGDKWCKGCVLSISTSYYHCSECDFFLHTSCADLPRKKPFWFHTHPRHFSLVTSECIFQCDYCVFETSGFAYTCDNCNCHYSLRCVSVCDTFKCQGHEHPLLFYKYDGLCNACGGTTKHPFRCNSCNFSLHLECISLPVKALHKSDEHLFSLTYHDETDYSESHYCDICEKPRDPDKWFYRCSTCNNSAHRECVLGNYHFIKHGSIYTKGDHPHPLTFVQKVQQYPDCLLCGERCFDLALECRTTGCNYIVHWECIKTEEL